MRYEIGLTQLRYHVFEVEVDEDLEAIRIANTICDTSAPLENQQHFPEGVRRVGTDLDCPVVGEVARCDEHGETIVYRGDEPRQEAIGRRVVIIKKGKP